jgi:4'-phosphopantetheinyl transferase superfamily
MENTKRAATATANAAVAPNGVTIAAVALPGGSAADGRAGAIAGRVAAASAARVEAGMVEVVRRPNRAPAVLGLSDEGRVRALPVALTVSHRLGRAVAAAHPTGLAMGVDLERLGSVPAGLERLFLSATERALLARYDATTLWALKEAAWKALGLEAAAPFHSLTLVCDAGGALRGLRYAGGETDAAATVWQPWTRFVAALVWLP